MVIENAAPVVPADLMTVEKSLPQDWKQANLVGRVMLPGVGPAVVYVREDGNVIDITRYYHTTSDLLEEENPAEKAKAAAQLAGQGMNNIIGHVSDILANSSVREQSKPYLLSPADFQEIEAAGVTFVDSMIERMTEQAAEKQLGFKKGEAKESEEKTEQVAKIRAKIKKEILDIVGEGFDFSKVDPGSTQALEILRLMQEKGLDMTYPKVGLGEEGEIFSKASAGTSVGHGAQAGYTTPKPGKEHESWTNDEPEMVLFVNSKGKIQGAALGNDVNDRKKESETAVLLHRAKVKNGSTVIGPFIRLFDDKFDLKAVEQAEVELEVKSNSGTLRFKGTNNMNRISRKPERIVAAAADEEREHNSGFAVFLGTMTIAEKDENGKDFTHNMADISTISSPKLGSISSVMLPAEKVQGLEKGPLALARNLSKRGVLLKDEKSITPHAGVAFPLSI